MSSRGRSIPQAQETTDMHDAEDILSDSLQSFYDHTLITLADAGSLFKYECSRWIEGADSPLPFTLTLEIPDTSPANWTLHASSIWRSSLYIADHLGDLRIEQHIHDEGRDLRILELGAGAGLPSFVIARCYDRVRVTVSDYPDDRLIQTLKENIERNNLSHRCLAVPYSWSSDPSPLFLWPASNAEPDCLPCSGFDVVIAADTLWNPESHSLFLDSLKLTLRRSSGARVHIVAGLHTGIYTIQAFLNLIPHSGLVIEEAQEKAVLEDRSRTWNVEHAMGEDDTERRRWVIWIVLKWASVE